MFLKKYYFIIITGCFCLYLNSHAQYGQLLHKTYGERVKPLLPLYDSVLWGTDSLSIFKEIGKIKKLAIDNDDDDLLLEAGLLRANYFFAKKKFPSAMVLAMIDSLKENAINKKKVWAEAMAENLAALYYFDIMKEYQLSFEHHQRVYHLISSLSVEEFPHKQHCLSQIADKYHFFKEYRESVFYNLQALEAEPLIKLEVYPARLTILNTLGLCYQQMKMFDSADYYFRQTYSLAEKNNSTIWKGISSGNLGNNLFLQKKYSEAIPLLEKDIAIATEHQDWGLASGSLMVLAKINLLDNKILQAKDQIFTARQYVYRSGQNYRLEKLYPLLSALYASLHQPSYAVMYLDSALLIKDSLFRQFNALQMKRAEQKVQMEQYRAEISDINSRKKINIIQRNVLIGAILLMMIIAVYFYRQQRRKIRNAKNELEIATQQLNDFSKNISEKNILIEILQQQNKDHHNDDILGQLQQSTILTDKDWEYFRQLFEKVHRGFFKRLKEKFPGLTPAETRFMALNKLKLSNKEMAAMLGISTDTIRQYRSRIRKKFNLGEESNLEDIADTI